MWKIPRIYEKKNKLAKIEGLLYSVRKFKRKFSESIGDRSFPNTPRAAKIMRSSTGRSKSPKPKDKDLSSLRKEVLKSKDKTVNTIPDSFAKRGKKDKEKEGKRQNAASTVRNEKNYLEEGQVITKKIKQEVLDEWEEKFMVTVNDEDKWDNSVEDMGTLNPHGKNDSVTGNVPHNPSEMERKIKPKKAVTTLRKMKRT